MVLLAVFLKGIDIAFGRGVFQVLQDPCGKLGIGSILQKRSPGRLQQISLKIVKVDFEIVDVLNLIDLGLEDEGDHVRLHGIGGILKDVIDVFLDIGFLAQQSFPVVVFGFFLVLDPRKHRKGHKGKYQQQEHGQKNAEA